MHGLQLLQPYQAKSYRSLVAGEAKLPPLPLSIRGRAELTTAAMRKVGRCDDCPPTYDEATFERLRRWRTGVAREAKVPAYVVFTDATLTAIAESAPTCLADLSRIAGVGARKLERYGEDVLAQLRGASHDDVRDDIHGSDADPGAGALTVSPRTRPGTPDDIPLP